MGTEKKFEITVLIGSEELGEMMRLTETDDAAEAIMGLARAGAESCKINWEMWSNGEH